MSQAPVVRGRSRTVALGAASQGLSAASNFLIALALGRGGGASAVAPFALAFIVYNALLGLQRSTVTDALLAVPHEGDTSHRDDARALTTAGLLAVTLSAALLVVGAVASSTPMICLGVALPALLLEDICRYLLFRRGQPGLAAFVDGAWAAVSCAGFVVILSHPNASMGIAVWGIGALVATICGFVVGRFRFAPLRSSVAWWRSELWRSSRWLGLESMLFHSDQVLTGFGLAAMAGRTAFGEWQVTESLLGVAAFLNVGLLVHGITHMSRRGSDRRTAWTSSATGFGFVALLTAVLVVVREPLTQLLYAGHVQLPVPTIVATGVFLALSAAGTGPISILRAERSEHPLPIARLVALIGFTPLAIVVAGHNFTAALWTLAAGSAAYLAIVTYAALQKTVEPAISARPVEACP